MPIATVAYSKNLQQCKAHNIAVEDHYIQNQLNQFRLHLQKQHKLNKMPEKKISSLLIDNTDIMQSLESTQKHIQDFYNTPIEALQEVHDLFEEELEKQVKLIEDEEILSRIINKAKNSQEHLEQRNQIRIDLEQNTKDIDETDKTSEEQFLDFSEIRKEEFNLENEILNCNSHNENVEIQQRTPSPLANTDEVLKPLRDAIEEQSALNLKCVRFDTEVNVYELQRETSICSNTSDGIDSVISELAEEALKELEMEDLHQSTLNLNETENPESNINLKGTTLTGNITTNNDELVVVGQVTNYSRRSFDTQKNVISSPSFSDETEENTISNREQSKIIEQLFQSRAHTNVSIMRKYFLKWVHYTTIEKIEREHGNCRADRVKKINIFLDKIRLEKSLSKCHHKPDNDDDLHGKHLQKKESMQALQINKKYQNK